MSRHFILDGYNVLHSTDRWADIPLGKRREHFLHFLDESGLVGAERNTITVILDGFAAPLRGIRLGRVGLIFSGKQDADTAINERVRALPNPKDAVVVTNDKDLQRAVRHAGAQIMTCENFLQLKKKSSSPAHSKKVESDSAESINAELKRAWNLK